MSMDLLRHGLDPRLARRGVFGAGVAAVGAVVAAPAAASAAPRSVATALPSVAGRRTWNTACPTAPERHVLNRFSFGFSHHEFARLRAAGGANAWFERQLNPASIPDPEFQGLLASMPDLYLPPAEQALQGNSGRKAMLYVQQQYYAATVARRAYSRRQVEAVMTSFWANHFYVAGEIFTHADYTRTIRQGALGRFEDLLLAAELHPAMLNFLSTSESTKTYPNENQARELMELHTLGRGGGGYTEDTVAHVARLLTGWTIDDYAQSYDPDRHWTGTIKALGWSSANASPDGREATRSFLRYLAHHPATAAFVCRKLAVRFVSDNPSDALVASLADVFRSNDTQIKPVLRVIFGHPEFLAAHGRKLRTPMEDCAGLLRAAEITVRPLRPVDAGNSALLALAWAPTVAGQPFSGWTRPDGWPDVASAWDGPARAEAMLDWHWRALDSEDLLPGAKRPTGRSLLPARGMRFDQLVDHLSRRLLGVPATDRLVQAACAATGCRIATTVTATSPVLNADWSRLLVTLFDSPSWLWK